RRHTRWPRDWSSDVCSSDLIAEGYGPGPQHITVRNSGTGQVERRLLLGTPSPDWSRYYTVTQVTGAAVLTALDPASGRTLNQTTDRKSVVYGKTGERGGGRG